MGGKGPPDGVLIFKLLRNHGVLLSDGGCRLNAKRAAVTEAKKEKATKKGRSDVGGGGAEEE